MHPKDKLEQEAVRLERDVVRLLKNWTLPVSMASGTLLYLLFAYTPSLDGAAQFFAPIIDAILPLFMFLILFVTFCKVDFRQLRPVAWHLWVGLFQVLFALVSVAIILVGRLQGDALILMEALLMCSICPGATAAAVVTQKLGGSLEQMTTYTFISNFITVVLIPIFFPMIEPTTDISFAAAFARIFYQVCAVLLVPMLLAYIVKHHLHRFHRWVVSVKDLSYYMWGVSLMIVTGTTVKNIVHADTTLWLLLAIGALGLILCIVQFAVGRFIGHYFGRAIESGQALGQKNTAFAIWISYVYLNPLSSVGPGCYILWQNIINSFEIWQQRKLETSKTQHTA